VGVLEEQDELSIKLELLLEGFVDVLFALGSDKVYE
jgi:hypothetical protein